MYTTSWLAPCNPSICSPCVVFGSRMQYVWLCVYVRACVRVRECVRACVRMCMCVWVIWCVGGRAGGLWVAAHACTGVVTTDPMSCTGRGPCLGGDARG